MKLKNFFAVLSAVVLASLITISCKPKNDEPEAPTLTLSVQTLTLNNKAQNPTEPQIQVSTNQTKWNVSTNAEWLTATVKGNGIVVSALANDLGRDRKGEVLVYAGGLVDKVVVTQSSADVFVELTAQDLNVPRSGAEYLVGVNTNAGKWEVQGQAEWVTVQRLSNILKFVVAPNETGQAREALIQVIATSAAGNVTKAIRIAQTAKSEDAAYFPFLDGKMSVYERAKKEVARGSVVLEAAEPYNSFFGPSPGFLALIPKADGFITATYVIPFANRLVWEQIVVVTDTWERISEGAFIEKLTEEGFTKDDAASSEKNIVYVNATKRYKVTLKEEIDGDVVNYGAVFEVYYVQEKPQPTFRQFPYLLKDFLDKPEKKHADVVAWMKEKKYEKDGDDVMSTKFPDQVRIQAFKKEGTVGAEEANDVLAFYYTGESRNIPKGVDKDKIIGSLAQFAQMFPEKSKVELMFWERSDGAYYPTNEFKALAEKEGFNARVIERIPQNTYFFISSKDLVLMVRAVKFSDYNEGNITAQLSLWYEDGASASSATLRNFTAKTQEEWKAKKEARMTFMNKLTSVAKNSEMFVK
ncbi:MAG: BACON domain-containing protein [Porphyromonas sp.]|nr:BACON domain-containing protein [Porphyromonas sp.]